MTIKAIETRYKGYRFRSRLEARWAVYFDTLNVEWDYEPEGFALSGDLFYLPDFWLRQVQMWAEVKPVGLNSDEWIKCQALANESGHPVLMLIGPPDFRTYWAIGPNIDGEEEICDYILDDVWLGQNRFYCATGAEYPESGDCSQGGGYHRIEIGVRAARSARFEHGESR